MFCPLKPLLFAACLCGLACLVGPSSTPAEDEPEFAAAEIEFFETTIRPLLVENCLSCHSGDDPEAGLRLDRRVELLKGGESGPAVVAGQPSESLLWHAVSYESHEMPPESQLPAESLANIKRWIELGLPWPSDTQLSTRREAKEITREDRDYWAFRPLRALQIPMVATPQWCREDLDYFVLRKLEEAGITPAPPANRLALLRRLCFDLTGLPPTVEQIERFLDDSSSASYEALVDELLAKPQFGEHWAQHWLDLVRYADSDGYKADGFRPLAWKYRDYVIRSFNANQPFDVFMVQQLAGDELPSPTADDLIATGYLRNWIYEYNQRDARTQWQYILDDITEVTGDVFWAWDWVCAKCHDHKYDPLLQSDYYQLQACFNAILPTDSLLATDLESRQRYRNRVAQWQASAEATLAPLAQLESVHKERVASSAINKFPPDIRELFHRAETQLTAKDKQLVYLGRLQIDLEVDKIDFAKLLKDKELERWQQLKQELAELNASKPPMPSLAWGVKELHPSEPVQIPGLEHVDLSPGIPQVLVADSKSAKLPVNESRRLALANWLVSDANPITARVMVNRVWQQLMGQGLAPNPNDFGQLSGEPSHPELLDHLAFHWRSEGWDFKNLIRTIVLSSTYQMSVAHPQLEAAYRLDPGNRLRWHADRRRLRAGQIRDAMVFASEELAPISSGPAQEHSALCRAVFLKVLRNRREPLLDIFDFPDRIRSQGKRDTTTTPLQSLGLVNGAWSLARAGELAQKVRSASGEEPQAAIQGLFERTLGRPAHPSEVELCLAFLNEQATLLIREGCSEAEGSTQAWTDLCHCLLNSNEFIYLD